MRLLHVAATLLLLGAVAVPQIVSGHRSSVKPGQIATGKYIVENVAMCATCHTPRLANGEFSKSRTLMGSHLAFKSLHPTARWVSDAPQIAGLPRWEDEEIVILLTTGKLETGLTMRPPMPQFHMTKPDAEAVVAYLRSLIPPPKKGARMNAFTRAATAAAK